ncbi:MAG: hypothetical protein CM15mP70_18500 [Pelagibacteraceae bacterium]|nr:MAG: hypothetical protein CM15mP70_18500 [Pelagibacteraceae bacterium]
MGKFFRFLDQSGMQELARTKLSDLGFVNYSKH